MPISENEFWWKDDEKSLHKSVFQHVNHLDKEQSHKELSNVRHMKLYGNFNILGLNAYNYSVDGNQQRNRSSIANRLTLNVIQSITDTATAKISKNKPRPQFLTNGGDWFLQEKAKKLTQFCEGIFHCTDIYAKARKVFLDSCIFGTGALKVFRKGNEIEVERVFINELKIDDVEAVYGEPRQMHQTKFIHRDVLISMFPEHKDKLLKTNPSSSQLAPASIRTSMIQVIESWHLPSGPTKDADGKPIKHDGVRSISVENVTLLKEPWDKPYFPFVFLRWGLRPLGFFGQGIAEQLQGIQLEMNKILKTIQISMHLTSIPKVFVDSGSNVVTSHLNNEIGGIIKYAGTKPSYESVGAVPRELFDQLDRLYQRAHEQVGVSQLSAASLKPAGLDSGKALREYNDIETERFMNIAQRYEEFFLDACEQMIDIAREIYADTKKFDVKVKGEKFLETIDWKDVDMEEDKYLMQVFPTSSLSSTPAGKLQDVQELLAAGFLNREQAIKLLDFPDVNAVTDLQTAALENIEKAIATMIGDGKYVPPEPFQNLALGLQTVQEAYLFHQNENAPEERLELLRRWMGDANALLNKARVQQLADQQQAAIVAEGQMQTDPAVDQAAEAQAQEMTQMPEGDILQ